MKKYFMRFKNWKRGQNFTKKGRKTISEKKPLCIFFCKYNFQKCTLSYLCTKNDWKQFAVSLSKKFSKCFDILVERYRECMNEYHTIYIIHGTYIKYYTIHVILYIPYILAILYISKFRYTSMIKLEKEIILLIYLNLILVSGKLPLGKLPLPPPPFTPENHPLEICPRENFPLWKYPPMKASPVKITSKKFTPEKIAPYENSTWEYILRMLIIW